VNTKNGREWEGACIAASYFLQPHGDDDGASQLATCQAFWKARARTLRAGTVTNHAHSNKTIAENPGILASIVVTAFVNPVQST
jgi:hypothetical protein